MAGDGRATRVDWAGRWRRAVTEMEAGSALVFARVFKAVESYGWPSMQVEVWSGIIAPT
jgi:hypothetical protein